jgi:hypothetical protein
MTTRVYSRRIEVYHDGKLKDAEILDIVNRSKGESVSRVTL